MLGTLAQFTRRVRRPALAAVAAAAVVLPAPSTSAAARGPDIIADVAEKVIDAVVNISTSQKVETRNSPMPQLPNDPQLDELFRDFFNRRGQGDPQNRERGPRRVNSLGSGFVLDPSGIVVTNNHVISEADEITVILNDGARLKAEIIGKDQKTDIALLRVKPDKPLKAVKFGDSEKLRLGEWVIAIGNPFSLGGTVTAGIVSARNRDINSGPYDNYIQTDAAINRGNSGGPLFNLDGEVVGVNTAIYSPSGGNVGIAFAVPAKTAKEVIDQLKSSGSVMRGWLGVKIESIDDDKAAGLGLGETRGALVNEVTANGPAADSGLKAGDAILSVNGDKIRDSRELARKIAEYSPGTRVNVEVHRYGKLETIAVKLGTFPGSKELAKLEQDQPAKPASTELSQLGISLAAATGARNAKDGVAISDVEDGSDAATKGLKTGDVILEVQGEQVASPADVEAGVKKAKELGRKAVLLRVKSGETVRFVAVQLKPA